MTKPRLIALALLALAVPGTAQDRDDAYFEGLHDLKAQYRKAFTESLKEATRVVIYLVAFDGVSGEEDSPYDEKTDLWISREGTKTRILDSKELAEGARGKLLAEIEKSLLKEEHLGGAMCHFPVHGLRIFRDEEVLYEGTFCWFCGNYSFTYPDFTYDWLDPTIDLHQVFSKELPIPAEELERFYKQYPGARPEKK